MTFHGDDAFEFGDHRDRISSPHRLRQLRATGLLEASRMPALDAVTELAAGLTDADMALVTLVDVDRQIAPSVHTQHGPHPGPLSSPISTSICQYVVMNDAPLVVGDARTHPALSSHPAVLDGSLVAYAGFPVRSPDGEVLGALCVVDVAPRTWSPAHLTGLANLATAVDTTIALQLSGRQLELDRGRLMSVLDSADHTLIIIADRDGHIGTMNQTAQDALVHRRADELGSDPTLAGLARAHAHGHSDLDLDAAHDWTFSSSAHHQVFSVRLSTLYDDSGEVDGYVAVGDDVTDRRAAEQALRDNLARERESSERLAALDAQRSTFIATASHELRTPVTSILGFTELLASGPADDLTSQQHDLVNRVLRNTRRLHKLIEDLLAFDQTDAEYYTPSVHRIDVAQLIRSSLESVNAALVDRDLVITKQVPHDVANLAGDRMQLERLFVNLVSNAIKFTPDGGTVDLHVRESGGHLVFEIRDSGLGMSLADQSKVFEPFYRGTAAQTNAIQGAGIGLSLVKRIIDTHGGTISLDSAPGAGTTVRFTLPTAAD